MTFSHGAAALDVFRFQLQHAQLQFIARTQHHLFALLALGDIFDNSDDPVKLAGAVENRK